MGIKKLQSHCVAYCGKIAKGLIGHVTALGLCPLFSGLSFKVINRGNIFVPQKKIWWQDKDLMGLEKPVRRLLLEQM